MKQKLLKNPSPGEILNNRFLEPLDMSQTALARAIDVPPGRINEIVLGKRSVTAETDARLCRYFGLSDGFFLRLQNAYEIEEVQRKHGREIARIKPLKVA